MTSSYEVKQLPDSKYYLVRTDVRDCVVTHAIWRRLYADASILGQANDYQEILEQRRRIGHAKAYEAALREGRVALGVGCRIPTKMPRPSRSTSRNIMPTILSMPE